LLKEYNHFLPNNHSTYYWFQYWFWQKVGFYTKKCILKFFDNFKSWNTLFLFVSNQGFPVSIHKLQQFPIVILILRQKSSWFRPTKKELHTHCFFTMINTQKRGHLLILLSRLARDS
jgi:hypothetical protein